MTKQKLQIAKASEYKTVINERTNNFDSTAFIEGIRI